MRAPYFGDARIFLDDRFRGTSPSAPSQPSRSADGSAGGCYLAEMRLALVALLVSACTAGVVVPRRGLVHSFAGATGCPSEEVSTAPLLDRVLRVSGCGTYLDYAQQFSAAPPSYRRSGERYLQASRSRWLAITGVRETAAADLQCLGDALSLVSVTPTLYDVTGCGLGAAFELQCGGFRCGWVHGDVVSAPRP
jgi:hypothetical protein